MKELLKSFGRAGKSFVLAAVLLTACQLAAGKITCEGLYTAHLQGVTADREGIYWSFTSTLVKTDHQGKKLIAKRVPSHHGDLCVKDGKIYVAVCLGRFNKLNPKGKNFVYRYDAATLKLEKRFPADEMIYGAGGITDNGTGFLVVGGLPHGEKNNLAAEYDYDFKLKRVISMPWNSHVGIQTACYFDNRYIFGIYAHTKERTKICTPEMKVLHSMNFDTSFGICRLPNGHFGAVRIFSKMVDGKKKWGAVLLEFDLLPDGKHKLVK